MPLSIENPPVLFRAKKVNGEANFWSWERT